MSAMPKAVSFKKKKTNMRKANAFVQSAVEILGRARAEKGRCVFVFTSAHRGAGTSFVVTLLAEELAAQFDSLVAIVPTDALKGCDAKKLPQGYTEQSQNLWTAVPDETLQHMPDFALENLWISPGAQTFDFILIDCPPLDASPLALRWGGETDGVFMVVQAGVTRVDQIETAQRLVQASTGTLSGMILNRRTYPIPKFLYKLL